MMAFVRSVTVSEISLKIDGQGLPPKVVRSEIRARSMPQRPFGRDAALESRLGPEVDALIGRFEVEF